MGAWEAAIAAVLAEHWSYEPTKDYDGWLCECGARIMGRDGDTDTAQQAHAAAIVAALDTPAAPVAEAGTYPCCAQCDAGCSGRHEWPCPRCQWDTKAVALAVADEGAARAKGGLA